MGVEKKKLTLSVDSDVILKAKELGLNLSEITENALKITSFANEEGKITQEKLVQAYQNVFQAMAPLLKKWDIHIPIGEYSKFIDDEQQHYDTFTFFLTSDEIYLWDEILADEEPLATWKLTDEKLPIKKFFDPEKIVKGLIDKLYEINEGNKIKINKLEVVTNLLKLLEQEKIG
ncbi:MAG: type II toxin-antitoxin system CcdA family antitoxin [Nanoarchaeota archaeon]|nr:type II toxin-antitoxin system CcdA family antitoxin [Nanoarchaeota archaeon]